MRQDTVARSFFSKNERYADVINGISFQGRQVIRGEDLQDRDTRTGVRKTSLEQLFEEVEDSIDETFSESGNRRYASKKPGHDRARDLIRKVAFGMNFAMIGIENQESVDPILPLRNMIYEAGEYERQASEIQKNFKSEYKKRKARGNAVSSGEFLYRFMKDSKLQPSVTFILYYGEDEWDGAEDLKGMMDFSNIPDALQELVQNFRINLISIRKLEDTSVFHTDVRQVFDLIRYADDKEKLMELVRNNPEYQHMDVEAYDMVVQYTRTEKLGVKKEVYRKGEQVDMCKAIQGLIDDARLEGVEAGKAEGKAEEKMKLFKLIAAMTEDDKVMEIPRLSREPDYYEAMLTMYGL